MAGKKSTSSIQRLPPPVKTAIDEALKSGRYTLDEIRRAIANEFGAELAPSRSSLGRYSQNFEKFGERLRESREVARVWAERLGNEPEGDVGKLVMELLRTMAFDATLALQEPDDEGKVQLDPKSINTLALAMQRLEAAGKWNIEREKAMREAIVKDVEDTLSKGPRKLDAEALALVRKAVRGES